VFRNLSAVLVVLYCFCGRVICRTATWPSPGWVNWLCWWSRWKQQQLQQTTVNSFTPASGSGLQRLPVDYFPTALLHKGIRVVLEPPKGFRQALMRGYQCLPRGCLAACSGSGSGSGTSSIPAQAWQEQLFCPGCAAQPGPGAEEVWCPWVECSV